jgi:hypothetical protein
MNRATATTQTASDRLHRPSTSLANQHGPLNAPGCWLATNQPIPETTESPDTTAVEQVMKVMKPPHQGLSRPPRHPTCGVTHAHPHHQSMTPSTDATAETHRTLTDSQTDREKRPLKRRTVRGSGVRCGPRRADDPGPCQRGGGLRFECRWVRWWQSGTWTRRQTRLRVSGRTSRAIFTDEGQPHQLTSTHMEGAQKHGLRETTGVPSPRRIDTSRGER